jgi:hypothetical protein
MIMLSLSVPSLLSSLKSHMCPSVLPARVASPHFSSSTSNSCDPSFCGAHVLQDTSSMDHAECMLASSLESHMGLHRPEISLTSSRVSPKYNDISASAIAFMATTSMKATSAPKDSLVVNSMCRVLS